MTRTLIKAMVRKNEPGCDNRDSRDRIAPSVRMFSYVLQTTNALIIIVGIFPTLMIFHKSAALPNPFLNALRSLNFNLSEELNLAKVHVFASIAF